MKSQSDSSDRAASGGCVARLVRLFHSSIRSGRAGMSKHPGLVLVFVIVWALAWGHYAIGLDAPLFQYKNVNDNALRMHITLLQIGSFMIAVVPMITCRLIWGDGSEEEPQKSARGIHIQRKKDQSKTSSDSEHSSQAYPGQVRPCSISVAPEADQNQAEDSPT
jgi:hypothetical protein